MELGSWEEVGAIIKKNVVRDYFQGYETGRGNPNNDGGHCQIQA